MDKTSDEVGGYDPYEVGYHVRRIEFPGGNRETLLRKVLTYKGTPGDVVLEEKRKAKMGAAFGLRSGGSEEQREESNRARAERRARQQLRYACHCIQADRLLTCTYAENMTDRKKAMADWNRFRKLVMARYPKWVFVAVMEYQDRGAIHFHAAVRGFQDVNYLRAAWRRVVGAGNIDVAFRQKRNGEGTDVWRVSKIAGYLGKYLAKSFADLPKGSRRFNASHDRERPVIERWWIQARTDAEAFEMVFRATAGGRAIDVKQWVSADGALYWVASPPPLRESVPF